jgi:hypothetical protein
MKTRRKERVGYCRLVTTHMSLTRLIVAGTDMTERTAEQGPTDLGKPFGHPIVFPVLTEADARARLSRLLNTTDLDWNQVTNLDRLVVCETSSRTRIPSGKTCRSTVKSANTRYMHRVLHGTGCTDCSGEIGSVSARKKDAILPALAEDSLIALYSMCTWPKVDCLL